MSRLLCISLAEKVVSRDLLSSVGVTGGNRWPMIESVRHNLKGRRKEPVRKPVWEPTAPSKLFRVRLKPTLTAEEDSQRQHMDVCYETNMRSIEHYFHDHFYVPTLAAGGLTDNQVDTEYQNQLEMLAANDRENQRVAELRDQRQEKLNQMMDQKIVVDLLEEQQRQREIGQQMDATVEREIKRSETYITHQTLEAAIDEALNHPITYDFAIDTNGNIYSQQPLHPYALRPNAVPDLSSNIEESAQMSSQDLSTKLEPKTLY